MKRDSLNTAQIRNKIATLEGEFNKIDEWFIPRDRSSFYLTHDFHPYFAAFPPELVTRLLEKYSQVGDVLLDPFMGGGSAIIEGYLQKRKTIGLDISTLSEFITEVKSRPIDVNDKEVDQILYCVREDITNHKISNYSKFLYYIPHVTNIDKWFTKESKLDLAILLHHLKKIEQKELREFLLLAFSSIVRKVSNATNGQLHLCTKRNKKIPLVYTLFEEKVHLMVDQMKQYTARLDKNYSYAAPELYAYDVRKMDDIISPNSVDIIITSPPYGTGSRYTEIYRLNFEWLELKKPASQDSMEKCRNFKAELKKALFQIYIVLKKGKYCLFVYGDPSTEGSLTRSAISDAVSVGFKYEGLISCPIRKAKSNHHVRYIRFIPKDFILVLKK